ncbi:esterase-like activity of phytase family protein [Mobilicoccus massiliensis]|uniref:esterase-like activity of phytase family protein n=1 Tax=Mobilicoccus massiliensis TaxID=1522310 RepID=UPI000B011AEE
MSLRPRRPLTILTAAALTLAGVPAAHATNGHDGQTRPGGHGRAGESFHRLATYPVYENLPAGVDRASETVAEISAASPDGRTVVYTDAPGGRIGFLDVSNPARPVGTGVIDLRAGGEKEVEPTSVAIKGDHVLVVVNTSESFTEPSGRLDVYRLSDRRKVRSIDLGGQPDSIALGSGAHADLGAVAIENERDEDAAPAGGKKGDLPQMPAGFVQVLDLAGAPGRWRATKVALTGADGSALAALKDAGLDTPADPEPEYVSINSRGQLAVTLQENNGIALVDLRTKKLTKVFSAGTATVTGVDVEKDGRFDATGTVSAPREPDSIGWVDDRYLATADEGDWKGGTRGWTIFDSRTGRTVWQAGNSLEEIFTAHGLHDEGRAGKKGVEPEGLAVATMNGRRYAFVGSERGNAVAVYDLSRPTSPRFLQLLPTTNGPEGLLPIPSRNLFVTSSEVDDASAQVRASVAVHRLERGRPAFPSIVSGTDRSGRAIGWGALSGLTSVGKGRLAAVSDSAYATARIYDVDARRSPARITAVTEVNDGTKPVAGLDIEGISAVRGGYWLASEGAKGADNKLVRVDRSGRVLREVALPVEVTRHIGKWGLEGVSATGSGGAGGEEVVTVALQRPLFTDPDKATGLVDGQGAGGGLARIGRYHVASGTWTWYGYPLEKTSAQGRLGRPVGDLPRGG